MRKWGSGGKAGKPRGWAHRLSAQNPGTSFLASLCPGHMSFGRSLSLSPYICVPGGPAEPGLREEASALCPLPAACCPLPLKGYCCLL